jgi:hypothetical protein
LASSTPDDTLDQVVRVQSAEIALFLSCKLQQVIPDMVQVVKDRAVPAKNSVDIGG